MAAKQLKTTHSRGACTSHSNGVLRRAVELPNELVVDIMNYLSLRDLRNTAATCRRYKAAAYHDAGLTLSMSIFVESLDPAALSKRVAKLFEIVEHALQNDLRLALQLRCQIYEYFGRSWEAYCELPPLADVFVAITKALPLLVKLTITAPDFFRTKLYPHLCMPAPHIKKLSLHRGVMDDDFDAYACPVPTTLFSGVAPKLSYVELHSVVPSEQPIPAFADVRRLEMVYDLTTPRIRFASAFPSLKRLDISFEKLSKNNSVPHFDFRDLALRRLTVYDEPEHRLFPDITAALALEDIPDVRHTSGVPDWCVSSWNALPGPLRMRVGAVDGIGDGAALVTLVADSPPAWRVRTYEFTTWERTDGTPLNGLAFLAPRLAYIRLESEFLSGLLLFGRALPALRRLWIDLPPAGGGALMPTLPGSADDDGDDGYSVSSSTESLDGSYADERPDVVVPCDALADVTIFATTEPMEISSLHVYLLARALGQDARAPSDRALLTLVGVRFADAGDETAVQVVPDVFANVDCQAFKGKHSLESREAGVWEI